MFSPIFILIILYIKNKSIMKINKNGNATGLQRMRRNLNHGYKTAYLSKPDHSVYSTHMFITNKENKPASTYTLDELYNLYKNDKILIKPI